MSNGVRNGATIGEILPSHAVPNPAEASASGKAQQAAAPKEARMPPPVTIPLNQFWVPRIPIAFVIMSSASYVQSVATTDSRGYVMKIGAVSALTGCNIETIRYYERIGIIEAPPRRGSYRDYAPADVDRLRFVRRGRELGFSLDEIQTLLGLAPSEMLSCATAQALAQQHLSTVRAKIADLQKIEQALSDLVARCEPGSQNHCPVVRSLEGTGNFVG